MEPEHWQLTEAAYNNATVIHPLGLLAVVVLGVATLLVPRRYALHPLLLLACFIPSAQRIVIFGLDFDLIRVLTLCGWTRIVIWGEVRGYRYRTLDGLVVAYCLAGIVTYTLLHGNASAFVNRLGHSFDALGLYFMCRLFIRDTRELQQLVALLGWLTVPLALLFTYEHLTQHNIFSVFGGVPEHTMVRDGRLRCQGAFSHPILAGCFWATVLPLIVSRWWLPRRQAAVGVVVGVIGCLTIIVMCASSTPVVGVGFAMMGAGFFLIRRNLRIVRWGVVALLCLLHGVMERPVWHLISRVGVVGGSTGWHRFYLIDQAIRRFPEWALLGTHSTAHWGNRLADVTNQYILEGVRGGAIGLALFVAIIAVAFRGVGLAWRAAGRDRARVICIWALGVALFVHCTSFLAVAYFGQIKVLWYLTLGAIGSLTPSSPPGSSSRRHASSHRGASPVGALP